MSRERRRLRTRRRVMELIAQADAEGRLTPGAVFVIDVRHDDRCALLRGEGPCDCDPDIRPPERVPAPDDN